MYKGKLSTLLAAMCLCALLLQGCAGKDKINKPAVAGKTQEKTLAVPSSFASEESKRDFALTAVQDGYFKEAAPLLEDLVKVTPDATSYRSLGTARYNLSDYAGAIAAWKKASDLNNALSGEMQNFIGNALRDSGKLAEAEAAYRESLKLNPKYDTAAINLASMLRVNGKVQEAITVLEDAVASNGNGAPASDMLQALKADLQATSKDL